jgi:transcriptional regulator with XRE-family HTH domain
MSLNPSEQLNPQNPCYNAAIKEALYNMESVPNKIKDLRAELGLTQRELAQKVSIHPAQLARYESGISTPSLGVLIRLAQYCEVSIDYLVFGVDKEAAKRSRIQDQQLLDLTRRIDTLKRPQRDRIKWAIEGLLNNQPK